MPGSAVLVGLLCPLLLWSARGYSPATPYQRRVSWSSRTGAGGPSGPVSSLTWAHVSMRLSAGEGEAREGHRGGSRAKGSGVSRRQQQQQQVGVLAGSLVGAWCWGVGAGRAGAKAAVQAPSAYYPQVLQGYSTLRSLVSDSVWAEVSGKGGDEIRRRLGTVGTSSPLFRLNKALDGLREALLDDEKVDVLTLAEESAALLSAITNADFLAYSSNFSSYGNGGGGTDYLEESRKALVAEALPHYTAVLTLLNLDPPQ